MGCQVFGITLFITRNEFVYSVYEEDVFVSIPFPFYGYVWEVGSILLLLRESLLMSLGTSHENTLNDLSRRYTWCYLISASMRAYGN